MENIKPTEHSDILSDKEIRRYALQIGIPEIGISGQEKIRQASVLVIGAGGKGTAILQNIVSMGVGTIGISDNFPVFQKDLSRQYLYGNYDLGKQKAIISRQKLMEINDLVEFRLHNVFLNEDNIEKISEPYDILIDATDNFEAHYLISDAAAKMNKPVVFGQVQGNIGQVAILNYQEGPSLRCIFPTEEKAMSEVSQGFVCQLSLMSIIGGIMAHETAKLILGMESQLSGHILSIDTGNYSFISKKVSKDPKNFF
jgi:adenylyltransferase/sulfurtransferase